MEKMPEAGYGYSMFAFVLGTGLALTGGIMSFSRGSARSPAVRWTQPLWPGCLRSEPRWLSAADGTTDVGSGPGQSGYGQPQAYGQAPQQQGYSCADAGLRPAAGSAGSATDVWPAATGPAATGPAGSVWQGRRGPAPDAELHDLRPDHAVRRAVSALLLPELQSLPLSSLLELKAAVGARALDERARASTRGTLRRVEIDSSHALSPERIPPVTAQDVSKSFDFVFLDQEVRLGPSTFAGARRAPDECGNLCLEAAIAQRFHFRDRPGHCGDGRQAMQKLFGIVDVHVWVQ